MAAGRPFQAYLHGAPKPPCQTERWQTLQDIYKTQGGMVITDPDISAPLFHGQVSWDPMCDSWIPCLVVMLLRLHHRWWQIPSVLLRHFTTATTWSRNHLVYAHADHLLNLACSVLQSDWAMITVLEDTTASLAGGRTLGPAAVPIM